jgi:tetratricopeptide (TPR) repeat protein
MDTCFVIMGFGAKTDFQSNPQRLLNLNVTYEDIIKPSVVQAGLNCVRADEIIHSTVIDKPMYDNLLSADLVIADLSTSNANALYELGVRHALRPHRTIVMAENNFSFPFDLNHLKIFKYEHLGTEIGYREVIRMQKLLVSTITTIMSHPEADSPVFLFIPSLRAANLEPSAPEAVEHAPADPAPSSEPTDASSFAHLLESFRAAKASAQKPADWQAPLQLLGRLQKMQPEDPFILQQLALATYKYRQPDRRSSLVAAKEILEKLTPRVSSDAETVGLWGSVHKQLWDELKNRDDLEEAVRAYARGYYIKNDYYNGINYAFMLDVRASCNAGDEAVADRVLARRTRQDVLSICDRLLNKEPQPADMALSNDELFWIGATKVEALFGLGRRDEAASLQETILAKERARLAAVLGPTGNAGKEADWKESALLTQLKKLGEILGQP